jgi:hypothetical protein
MSLLSKLFGGGSAAEPSSVDHNGFAITPTPIREGSRWRVGARIDKDGRTHELIRADMLDDLTTAREASVRKAKQMIDEQGDRLFG